MAKSLEEIFAANADNTGMALSISEQIEALKTKEVKVRNWVDIEKEYNPLKHPVMTDESYKDIVKPKGGGIEKVCRIPISLQRLAAKRMTQLCFGLPVKRMYKAATDQEKSAAKLIEKIYQRNHIDSMNIERGVYLFASCELMTLWYGVESRTTHNQYGIPTKIKLRSKSYSPMNGDKIYPLFDDGDDMIALSVEYTRNINNVSYNYFDVFTENRHIQWKSANSTDWTVEVDEEIKLLKIPGIYTYRPTPIWEDTSNDVYEIEWTLSRNGNYIRKNSKPLFVMFSNDKVETGTGKEGENDSRGVIRLPETAKAEYVTWEQATASIQLQLENLYRAYFTQLQLPDMSFDNMKTVAMSGEARKMMFIDATMKVLEERGRWLEFFDREVSVVKEFAKIMFPTMASVIESLVIENVITPFNIADDKETISNIMTATGGKAVLPVREGVIALGWSDDIDQTMKELEKQATADITEPTL